MYLSPGKADGSFWIQWCVRCGSELFTAWVTHPWDWSLLWCALLSARWWKWGWKLCESAVSAVWRRDCGTLSQPCFRPENRAQSTETIWKTCRIQWDLDSSRVLGLKPSFLVTRRTCCECTHDFEIFELDMQYARCWLLWSKNSNMSTNLSSFNLTENVTLSDVLSPKKTLSRGHSWPSDAVWWCTSSFHKYSRNQAKAFKENVTVTDNTFILWVLMYLCCKEAYKPSQNLPEDLNKP